MKILDFFSWLPAKEISLEELEQIFTASKKGTCSDAYTVSDELPPCAADHILACQKELINEGKNVVAILKDSNVIAVAGYRE